jgi:hypothetical protein
MRSAGPSDRAVVDLASVAARRFDRDLAAARRLPFSSGNQWSCRRG